MPDSSKPHIAESANPASKSAAKPAESFRRRFDKLEKQRTALIARVRALGSVGVSHPGHKRALTLLTVTFRKASIAERAAILQAAAWLIDVLERLLLPTV